MPGVCYCLRSRSTSNGIANGFSKKPAARQDYLPQPGSRAQQFKDSRQRFFHDPADAVSSNRSGIPPAGPRSTAVVWPDVHGVVHHRLLPAEEPGETAATETHI